MPVVALVVAGLVSYIIAYLNTCLVFGFLLYVIGGSVSGSGLYLHKKKVS